MYKMHSYGISQITVELSGHCLSFCCCFADSGSDDAGSLCAAIEASLLLYDAVQVTTLIRLSESAEGLFNNAG